MLTLAEEERGRADARLIRLQLGGEAPPSPPRLPHLPGGGLSLVSLGSSEQPSCGWIRTGLFDSKFDPHFKWLVNCLSGNGETLL